MLRSKRASWFSSGASGGPVAWDDVTSKPETFPPSSHTNSVSDIWDIYAGGVMMPIGFSHANLTAVSAFVTNTTYFFLLGRAVKPMTSFQLRFRVTTALITPTWAECGICTGAFAMGSTTTLTRRGYTDIASIVNSTGQKTVSVTTSGIVAGDYVWAAIGNQSATLTIYRGGLADDLQCGTRQEYGGRLSTMPDGQATTLQAANRVPIWLVAYAT